VSWDAFSSSYMSVWEGNDLLAATPEAFRARLQSRALRIDQQCKNTQEAPALGDLARPPVEMRHRLLPSEARTKGECPKDHSDLRLLRSAFSGQIVMFELVGVKTVEEGLWLVETCKHQPL
jgi:hypothetical protein